MVDIKKIINDSEELNSTNKLSGSISDTYGLIKDHFAELDAISSIAGPSDFFKDHFAEFEAMSAIPGTSDLLKDHLAEFEAMSAIPGTSDLLKDHLAEFEAMSALSGTSDLLKDHLAEFEAMSSIAGSSGFLKDRFAEFEAMSAISGTSGFIKDHTANIKSNSSHEIGFSELDNIALKINAINSIIRKIIGGIARSKDEFELDGFFKMLTYLYVFLLPALTSIYQYHAVEIYKANVLKKDYKIESKKSISKRRSTLSNVDKTLVLNFRFVNTKDDPLLIRDRPSMKKSNIIGRLPDGALLHVIDKDTDRSWIYVSVKVDDDEIKGWVNRKYTETFKI